MKWVQQYQYVHLTIEKTKILKGQVIELSCYTAGNWNMLDFSAESLNHSSVLFSLPWRSYADYLIFLLQVTVISCLHHGPVNFFCKESESKCSWPLNNTSLNSLVPLICSFFSTKHDQINEMWNLYIWRANVLYTCRFPRAKWGTEYMQILVYAGVLEQSPTHTKGGLYFWLWETYETTQLRCCTVKSPIGNT